MTGECLAPRHGDEPVDAEPHAVLCRPCHRGLSRDLRTLPGLHADLEHMLVTAQAHGRGNGGGLPVNEPASDCRSQIHHDLAYWCREVTAERGLDAPPVLDDGEWPANPVTVMCGWLHGQVTWCSFREWAGDMAGAVSADAGRARALLDPWVTKQFEIPGADGLCLGCGEGRVSVTVYASDGDRRRSFIGCPACGTRWEPESWLGYGKRVVQRRTTMEGAALWPRTKKSSKSQVLPSTASHCGSLAHLR